MAYERRRNRSRDSAGQASGGRVLAGGWPVRAGRLFFYLALVGLILPQGAVSPIAINAAALPLIAALGLALLAPPQTAPVRRAFLTALWLAAALAGFALFQSLAFPGNPFANPIWGEVGDLLGQAPAGAISVEPTSTRAAVVPLAMPFLVYAAGLALFEGDAAAARLLRMLLVLGTAFAGFGLLQVAGLKDSLFLAPKTAYLDSLTSVFVNRNTAGTLLGIASLVALTAFTGALRQIRSAFPGFGLLGDRAMNRQDLRAAAFLLCLVLCLLALFLTRSRGAIFSTALCYGLVVPLLVWEARRTFASRVAAVSTEPAPRQRVGLAAVVVLSILAVAAVFWLFGAQAVSRMSVRGFDPARLCVYESTTKIFADNWLFGTGLGTFSAIFPTYREVGCGPPLSVYLRAHNVFLEGLSSLGLIFIPAAAVVYAHILRNLAHGIRERRRLRHIPIIALGGVLLVTLHGLTDFSLQIPGMAAYLAAYLAAATAICFGRLAGRGREPD